MEDNDFMVNRQYEFVHFETTEILNNFLDFIKDKNIQIKHKCCNEKGICISLNSISLDFIERLVEDFKNQNKKNIELIETSYDICCICREMTNKALNCDKPHNICLECITNVVDECPYCRRKLN